MMKRGFVLALGIVLVFGLILGSGFVGDPFGDATPQQVTGWCVKGESHPWGGDSYYCVDTTAELHPWGGDE